MTPENPFVGGFRRRYRPFAIFFSLFRSQGFTVQESIRIVRAIDDGDVIDAAQMVKLVDTPASGAGD
ncbi:hypothetical protein, partial [Pseudomonas gingeri]